MWKSATAPGLTGQQTARPRPHGLRTREPGSRERLDGRPAMPRRGSAPVILEWDTFALENFYRNPTGPLGTELMDRLAAVVLAGAKRRALRRTGNMIDAMRYELGEDEFGQYADVLSPVQDPATGFPYAV